MGFDTTPAPNFLRAMQAQKWTVAGALAELIDNSFGKARGDARWVSITHDTKNRTITVLDDGEGMESLGRIFQLGNTIGRAPGDIGIYGSGGTMAILWLPRTVEIWTVREGKVSYDSVTWSEWIKAGQFPVISDTWKNATLGNTPLELFEMGHGTLIKLHLANERSFQSSNVKRDLARTYAPALRLGKHLTWTTIGKGGGTDILADPIVMPTDPEKLVRFNLSVDVEGELLEVDGEIGVIDDLSQEQSRVSIGFGPRVIAQTRDCYSSPDGSERYGGVGVGGWLDLGDGWQPYLSTTKDGMNDQPVWDVLMGHVFDKIKPLLKEVDEEKISIELLEIGIMLEAVLENTEVEVPSAGKRIRDEGGELTIGQRHGTDDPDEAKDPSRPASPADGDGDDATRPAVTRINIMSVTNDELSGMLCKAEIAGKGIDVLVNADHDVVKQSLIRKPVNRELLHLLVVREIAVALADDDGLAQQVFKPRVIRSLEGLDGRGRERLIARMLIDLVKRKAS